MQKIILFYKFAPVSDPESVKLWQQALCSGLQLRGRILLSTHGINGTLGGDLADLKAYVRQLRSFSAFKETAIKWSDGGREDFPKLSIKVRDEIVSFGAAEELIVDQKGVVNGGKHLSPEQVHDLVRERGEDVVFFDGRNKYESQVGKFKNAVIPDVTTSKDFIAEIESGKYEAIKGKPVITYCTGGVRCEILSVLMKNRGFKEVYQIDGGIVKYGETYADEGLWEGSLHVFDARLGVKFSDNAKEIGACEHCQEATSHYVNCVTKTCNKRMLLCVICRSRELCAECEG